MPILTHSISVDLTPKKREKTASTEGKYSSEQTTSINENFDFEHQIILGLTRATSATKKRISLSQSLDLRGQNESRSRVMTEKELDEMAYRLYANACRADFQRIENPIDVEQRKLFFVI